MRDGAAGDRTVLALVEEYLSERVALGGLSGRSPSTVGDLLRRFARALGDKPIDAVDKRDVVRFIANGGQAYNSKRWTLSQIRTFCEWAIDNELIETNPARGLGVGRPDAVEPRFLEAAEVASLYEALPSPKRRHPVVIARNACATAFAVQMGLRRVELHRCNVEDIDREKRFMAVRGKGHRGKVSRHEPITDEAWTALEEYLALAPASAGPLFRSTQTGGRLSDGELSTQISEAMIRAGVKRHAHDGRSLHALRHTAAQHLIDAGVDILDVQQMLGHTSVKTTEIYLRRSRAAGLRGLMEGRSYRPPRDEAGS